MAYIISRRSTLLALFISLLLHITTILYLDLQRTNIKTDLLKKQAELLNQLPEKTDKNPAWIETKARNSSFGAPVLFRDEPDEEILPHLPSQDHNKETQSQHKEEENNKQPEQSTERTNIEKNLDVKQKSTQIRTIAPQKTTVQKTVHTTTSGLRAVTQKVTPPPAPSRPLTMHKKQLTLAQLTQGVLNYAKEEGQHAVSMIGTKGGIPSEKQMQYERYLQKLQWCIQNSFNINNDRFPCPDESANNISVFLALNKDGTLHNLRLVKSSKDPRIDAFIMFVFRDASSGFPPVPHYLPHNPFSITFVFDINPIHKNMGIQRRS